MKKIVLFMALSLMFVSELAIAQKCHYLPIQDRKKGGYTKLEIYNFATGSSQLSKNYNDKIIELVTQKLRDAGEDIDINIDVKWILQQVTIEKRILDNFRNSHRCGNDIYYYNDIHYEGRCGVFSYNNCVVPIFKDTCMNLVDLPLENPMNENDLERKQKESAEDNRQQADLSYENPNYNDNSSNPNEVFLNKREYDGGYRLNDAWNRADYGTGMYLPPECPSQHQYEIVFERPKSYCDCFGGHTRKLEYTGGYKPRKY